VQNVLANYWVYSSLMGLPLASEQALLARQWPQYKPDGIEVASLPADAAR
jgi:hypothetical protein